MSERALAIQRLHRLANHLAARANILSDVADSQVEHEVDSALDSLDDSLSALRVSIHEARAAAELTAAATP